MFKYILGVMIFSLGLTACSSSNDTATQETTPAEKVITPAEQVITPAASALTMSFTPTKAFRFNWPAATNAPYYNLSEAATTGSGYTLIKTTTATSFDHVVPTPALMRSIC